MTDFVERELWTPDEQLAEINSLRPQIAQFQFVFYEPEDDHPLVAALSGLPCTRRVGIRQRLGYDRPAEAIVRVYSYDRSIVAALRDLGGLFTRFHDRRGDQVEFTRLGNVDVVLCDDQGAALLHSITHEGMVFVRANL